MIPTMFRVTFPILDFATTLVRYSSTTIMSAQFSKKCVTKLAYYQHGTPWRVVCLQATKIPEPKENEVVIRMLAAPVNQADINIIEGKYPGTISLPATPGVEGIGEVLETGSEVTEYSQGDHVVPLDYSLGTWRTHLVVPKDKLFRVPKELGIVEGATLASNPCVAFRMLKDFVDLKPGDTVIQNAANSTAGQCVIQLCDAWGLNTVNIVRERSDLAEVKYFLRTLGATCVLTDEELRKTEVFKKNELRRPKLALNCVGGESAWNIVRDLQPGGIMVTYGGMSKQPVLVPTSALVFKNIQVCGFWLTEWLRKNADTKECQQMFEELTAMLMNKKLLAPPHEVISYNEYQNALMKAINVKGMTGKKYIINFDPEEC